MPRAYRSSCVPGPGNSPRVAAGIDHPAVPTYNCVKMVYSALSFEESASSFSASVAFGMTRGTYLKFFQRWPKFGQRPGYARALGRSFSYGLTYGSQKVAAWREERNRRSDAPQSPLTAIITLPLTPRVPPQEELIVTAQHRRQIGGPKNRTADASP
jgi:hypothetical protein